MNKLEQLEAARTTSEILAAVAQMYRDDTTPTEDDLIAWFNTCPHAVRIKANQRLADVKGDGRWSWLGGNIAINGTEMREFSAVGMAGDNLWFSTIRWIHADWVALENRPRHPLGPIVEAWQNRAQPTEPYIPKKRAVVPKFDKRGQSNMFPDFPDARAPARIPEQMEIPDFGPAVKSCPSWLLWLYDRAGGDSMRQGRGAPWDLHMFVSAFLHLPVDKRDFGWRTLQFPHLIEHERDWPIPGTPSVERWLFPTGWDKTNRRKYWHRLPEALERMKRELGYVPIGGASIALVYPSVIPTSRDFPMVEFTIRVPQAAAHGARIDWNTLRKYRLESAALYRGYMAAAAWLDRTAHDGHAITAEIAGPLLRPNGQPGRSKGGKIRRDRDNMIENPAAKYVAPLGDADLARMIGLDPDDKRRRHDARRAFERLHDDGVIDLRKDGLGWRIFGPVK